MSTEKLYRQRVGSDVWHWEPSCSQYPSDALMKKGLAREIPGGVGHMMRRPRGDACNQCLRIAKRREKRSPRRGSQG